SIAGARLSSIAWPPTAITTLSLHDALPICHDTRLSRIFGNKVIRVYPAFKDFYGLEEPIEQVVSHFRHAAQGLEEKKQILYLLRSEEHTSELQSRSDLVCRLLLEKKNNDSL